jgi:hypothetical protein
VARQHSHFFHFRFLFPYNYLIFRVAMSTNELIYIFSIGKITYLRSSIDPMKWFTSQSVPESYTPISSSTSRTHHTMLVGRPCYGFDSSLVLIKLDSSLLVIMFGPNYKFIIITSRSKLLFVW